MRTRCLTCLGASALLALQAAAAYPAFEGDYVIRDFKFASGESLPELRIHYRTFGAPRADSHGVVRNAVLIMHGTGGSSEQFVQSIFAGLLFGPGQPLDATRFYIVLPDGIGHGNSLKPSDGLHRRFHAIRVIGELYRLLRVDLAAVTDVGVIGG